MSHACRRRLEVLQGLLGFCAWACVTAEIQAGQASPAPLTAPGPCLFGLRVLLVDHERADALRLGFPDLMHTVSH